MNTSVLKIENLTVSFEEKKECKQIVDGISFEVKQGEIVGIVGESGSGKSMTALAVMGLLKENAVCSGAIYLEGEDLLSLCEKERREKRGTTMAMIFQEPMTSLNSLLRVGKQVEEVLKLHTNLGKKGRKSRTLHALLEAGFETPEEIYDKYPHQLSGGMRQRVMIAMAMMLQPRLLIADEPTTALDASIQSKILDVIKELTQKYHTSVIFVSHDLGVIKSICQRAIVMQHGKIVEQGEVNTLFQSPKQEYTKELIDAIPKRKCENRKKLEGDREQPVLMVKNLQVSYQDRKAALFAKEKEQRILNGVSLELYEGEILGIVGESGSGKTTLVKAMVGLLSHYDGEVNLYKNRPQMVFQDPYSSLNPVKTVGWLLEESIRVTKGASKRERRELVEEMICSVGLSKEYLKRYPSKLSGGQRQRVAIAMALITNPKVVILDEPVSALDVTVQAQILELLLKLRKQYRLSYVFISHDLNVISQMCDRVCVIYQGEVVEENTVDGIFDAPKHPYTKRLVESQPK